MTQKVAKDLETKEKKEGNIQLWQFILELLNDPANSDTIRWTSANGDFQVLDPDNLAKLWGRKKGRSNMTYDKLCRALRYYYAKEILIKIPGQRYSYRFLWKPTHGTQTLPYQTLYAGLNATPYVYGNYVTNPATFAQRIPQIGQYDFTRSLAERGMTSSTSSPSPPSTYTPPSINPPKPYDVMDGLRTLENHYITPPSSTMTSSCVTSSCVTSSCMTPSFSDFETYRARSTAAMNLYRSPEHNQAMMSSLYRPHELRYEVGRGTSQYGTDTRQITSMDIYTQSMLEQATPRNPHLPAYAGHYGFR